MDVKFKEINKHIIVFISTSCIILSILCFSTQLTYLNNCEFGNGFKIIAAQTAFPNGRKLDEFFDIQKNIIQKKEEIQVFNNIENEKNELQIDEETSQKLKTQPEEEKKEKNHDSEKTFKIVEGQCKSCGTKCENFYVRNEAGKEININKELKTPLDISIKKNDEPQVLIVHTHTSEAYMEKDCGFYYESFNPHATDGVRNVVSVGRCVKKELSDGGIKTIHDETYHDTASYKGSYERCEKTIRKHLKKHPSITVVLDLHRDSLGEKEKFKPTFKKDGKKGAQIMILSGCDDGTNGFKDWIYNFRFALKLQDTVENMFPGITRPLYFNKTRYNMHVTHASLLIEIGSDANTIDEARYSASLLGRSLLKVLENLQEN
ncbi:MAG: stage II sporulation protein P [Oscillospiraceae bacterium]|jgi:stage II sporulation protein P|nr:stage II sporulation protein P [Oscillospiraceae bacterium]